MIYTELTCGSQKRESIFSFIPKNYDGYQFATSLNEILTAVADGFSPHPVFNVSYVLADNILAITQTDERKIIDKIDSPILLRILTDEELRTGSRKLADARTINAILRNTTPTVIT